MSPLPQPYDLWHSKETEALRLSLRLWRVAMARLGWIEDENARRAMVDHTWVVCTFRLRVPDEHLGS